MYSQIPPFRGEEGRRKFSSRPAFLRGSGIKTHNDTAERYKKRSHNFQSGTEITLYALIKVRISKSI